MKYSSKIFSKFIYIQVMLEQLMQSRNILLNEKVRLLLPPQILVRCFSLLFAVRPFPTGSCPLLSHQPPLEDAIFRNDQGIIPSG